MIQIKLDENEVIILKDLVDTCLSDLRDEIHATDNLNYKEMLKQRKAILTKLADSLGTAENKQPAS